MTLNNNTAKHGDDDTKPVIIIEAGQLAGSESTNLVLVLIQQLAACMEYEDMIGKVKWIILPCINPDGLEYSRYVSTVNISTYIHFMPFSQQDKHIPPFPTYDGPEKRLTAHLSYSFIS